MVALVRGVHGLRGVVRVEVLTDHPETRFIPGVVLHREGRAESLTITSAEAVADGPGWRIQFAEIRSREAADTLRGAYLEAEVSPELELGRGEYYWHEIVGCEVRGVDGVLLGTVRDVYRVAENEVFVVDGGEVAAFDLPAVRAFIRVFAPRRGEIVVDAASLDLRPRKRTAPDPDRPKAPRRRRRGPARPAGAADAASGETGSTGEATAVAEPDAAEQPATGGEPAEVDASEVEA